MGFAQVLSPVILLNIAIGVVVGIVAGAIPGFTIVMAIALTLPFTFAMPSVQGLATMLGVFVGGLSGGLISATLLGIPGTPSSVATVFDGYPMTLKGEPGRALGLGTWSSFFGSAVGIIILMTLSPQLAVLGVKMGPWEYFSLITFGLTVVASLVGKNVVKGLISGFLGLVIAVVGADPIIGFPRFTFGIKQLSGGLSFLITLIGLYAISQLIGGIEERSGNIEGDPKGNSVKRKISIPHLQILKDIFGQPINLIRSSLIGVFIGALPGAGASISNLLAYDQAKKASKHPEKMGTGIPDGIIASEAANSATAGGGLVPMIALGIPGSEVSAMMLGALMVHGIMPGPLLIKNHPDIVSGVFAAFWMASFLMLLIQFLGLKVFMKITQVPMKHLVPLILALCVVGAFSMNNRIFDTYVLFFFGVVGYILRKVEVPLAPFVLANVLGNMVETNLRRSLMTDPDWTLFFTRPASLAFLLLAVGSVIFSIIQEAKVRKKMIGAPLANVV